MILTIEYKNTAAYSRVEGTVRRKAGFAGIAAVRAAADGNEALIRVSGLLKLFQPFN